MSDCPELERVMVCESTAASLSSGCYETGDDIDIDRLTERLCRRETTSPVDRLAVKIDNASDILLVLRSPGQRFHDQQIFDGHDRGRCFSDMDVSRPLDFGSARSQYLSPSRDRRNCL